MADYDGPWKELLEQCLRQVLALLFDEVEKEIDWSHDYVSLEQELRQLFPQGEGGKRLADKLIKVRWRTGDDRYLHVEVQGEPEDGFPRRVFVYHYRSDDRFGLPVDSLIILADDDPTWMPTTYTVELSRTRLTLEFEPVKLLDWAGREGELEANPNPTGLFVVAYLQSRRTRHDAEERARLKLRLTKNLLERRLELEETGLWNRLLDWLLPLPPKLEGQVWQEVRVFVEENKMPFVTFAERFGREEGRKEGIMEGKREGLLGGLRVALRLKFGEAGAGLYPALSATEDLDRLQAVLDAVEQAASVDDLRALLPTNGHATPGAPPEQ